LERSCSEGLVWKQITPDLATNVSACDEMRIPQSARTELRFVTRFA
jgi:hypothetical protein